jgi:hypothetical protein
LLARMFYHTLTCSQEKVRKLTMRNARLRQKGAFSECEKFQRPRRKLKITMQQRWAFRNRRWENGRLEYLSDGPHRERQR